MANEHVNPSTLFRMPGMTQIVISAPGRRLAFIAGQGAFDAAYQLVGENDLYAQVVQAFTNLKQALAGVGATPADVLSSNMYVVDLDEEKTEIFVKAMGVALDGEAFPPNASTIVGVTRLGDPRMLVEVSAIASVP